MFAGKVVLVTGASSGIGAAVAVRFAKEGAILALTGRNTTNLEQTAEKCLKNSSSKPLTVAGELSKEEDVKNIVDTTIKHYGKLDVLVNNAGMMELGSIEQTSLEQFDRTFNTNVRAVYHLTQLTVPYLIETKGNIVNVSSVVGMRSFPGLVAYGMSKSALDQFTRCVALDLAPKQVRVNSVNPGYVPTNLHRNFGMTDDQYKGFQENTKKTYPLGRYGEPNDVVEAILFLASERASFITGHLLPVDGGKNICCPR